jgi:hypothetical protein
MPKIITGKLAPARYVPSAATFIGTQDHIGRRCIAGSGFDIWSDLFLAIVASSRTVHERSMSSITRERRKAIKTKMPTTPGDKIGDTAATDKLPATRRRGRNTLPRY